MSMTPSEVGTHKLEHPSLRSQRNPNFQLRFMLAFSAIEITNGLLPRVGAIEKTTSVREDTAELASYALSDRKHDQSRALNLPRSRSPAHSSASPLLEAADRDRGSPAARERLRRSSFTQIAPAFQASEGRDGSPQDGPSMLSNLLRGHLTKQPTEYGTRDADYDGRSIEPSDSEHSDGDGDGDELTADDWDAGSGSRLRRHSSRLETVPEVDEHSPLLAHSGSKRGRRAPRRRSGGSEGVDIEAQQANSSRSKILNGPKQFRRRATARVSQYAGMLLHPGKWDGRAIWEPPW
ncbi:unnamed protein product [Parascedosporium putredinis]|uniref:Uncharacterized protein n=1 Tax=Parascedosporium putredinis TaxID=1442378 RepID=A0A9P1H7N6_9PEZI|nr:unnamed protein product [Parascedosporium putredinis]CAI7999030.1 unnamed protein product [Parascedosporium putredinis]